MPTHLIVVGDIHGHWSAADVEQLDSEGADAIIVVGDLAGLRWSATLGVARGIAALRTPTLVLPGNHDGPHPGQLLAEVAGQQQLGDWLTGTLSRRVEALREALSPHTLAGYSAHRIGGLTVVAGRPHSMGGPRLSFPGHMAAAWSIETLEASAERLCEVVDAVDTEDVIFLAHNGPTGLGATRDAIFGCDFRREAGDWGDPDLAVAVEHARRRGLRVRAVVAGHMHRRLRGGGQRRWRECRDDTLYLNAAEVPRVARQGRHHVRLDLTPEGVTARDCWL